MKSVLFVVFAMLVSVQAQAAVKVVKRSASYVCSSPTGHGVIYDVSLTGKTNEFGNGLFEIKMTHKIDGKEVLPQEDIELAGVDFNLSDGLWLRGSLAPFDEDSNLFIRNLIVYSLKSETYYVCMLSPGGF